MGMGCPLLETLCYPCSVLPILLSRAYKDNQTLTEWVNEKSDLFSTLSRLIFYFPPSSSTSSWIELLVLWICHDLRCLLLFYLLLLLNSVISFNPILIMRFSSHSHIYFVFPKPWIFKIPLLYPLYTLYLIFLCL